MEDCAKKLELLEEKLDNMSRRQKSILEVVRDAFLLIEENLKSLDERLKVLEKKTDTGFSGVRKDMAQVHSDLQKILHVTKADKIYENEQRLKGDKN